MNNFSAYFIKEYRLNSKFYESLYSGYIDDLDDICELIYYYCDIYFLKEFGGILKEINFEEIVKEYIFNKFLEVTFNTLDKEKTVHVNKTKLIKNYIMNDKEEYKENEDLYEQDFIANYKYLNRYIKERNISGLLIEKRKFYIRHIKLLRENNENKILYQRISKKRYNKIRLLDLKKFYDIFDNDYFSGLILEKEYKYHTIYKIIEFYKVNRKKFNIHMYDLLPIMDIPDVKLRIELIRLDYIKDIEDSIKQVIYLSKVFYKIVDYHIKDVVDNIDRRYLKGIIDRSKNQVNMYSNINNEKIYTYDEEFEILFKEMVKLLDLYEKSNVIKDLIYLNYLKNEERNEINIKSQYTKTKKNLKRIKKKFKNISYVNKDNNLNKVIFNITREKFNKIYRSSIIFNENLDDISETSYSMRRFNSEKEINLLYSQYKYTKKLLK
ncbi:hypothetical protein [Clostridium intestinale]|uniref:Uncharacterized protein n=1 Tax=Clostridium intestinale DSM 6191 TaxID=1121320 RepID=A0A1M6A4P0_9CLOT|nr:hypothetical protein [Clostridium intestinale]SHI31339.1 hypothetical protein SAMN02745941_03609 [Clostridium intestinale DSM 6191]